MPSTSQIAPLAKHVAGAMPLLTVGIATLATIQTVPIIVLRAPQAAPPARPRSVTAALMDLNSNALPQATLPQ